MRRAYFSKVTYDPDFGIQCKIQYAEVDHDLYVIRAVEVDVDGKLGFADSDNRDGKYGAILPEKEFPDPDNLPSEPGKYVSEEISRREFEGVWSKAQHS